ncbi:hypothetical protein VOLCADRAFT_97275 [Volvox carteri f. nagariensis]|uniref:Uncharacterized protein n=1 Tax=Volvox carteri f. nagariensis TaxID=3068 RepID=D8UCC3_VOLCA|nr:uncharacterized protein VOLCADRAFT_97275 [Volvox carteri f. nagariensis]EFJ42620.1 hypothetical protein VOLCADRAFT_97275 [Volvox carteri f. nagariensis]|eukprot:XP_002956271.1 hypothetical protein VOLCADRAFT_97275 [Volvox carteri f. nagariensis]
MYVLQSHCGEPALANNTATQKSVQPTLDNVGQPNMCTSAQPHIPAPRLDRVLNCAFNCASKCMSNCALSCTLKRASNRGLSCALDSMDRCASNCTLQCASNCVVRDTLNCASFNCTSSCVVGYALKCASRRMSNCGVRCGQCFAIYTFNHGVLQCDALRCVAVRRGAVRCEKTKKSDDDGKRTGDRGSHAATELA